MAKVVSAKEGYINARINPELKKKMKIASIERDVHMQDFLEEAISKLLAEWEKEKKKK